MTAYARFERAARKAQAAGRVPALSVALHRADREPWVLTVGDSGNPDHPLGPDSRFRIGSVTKTFTAVLVMRARDEGLLDLDFRQAGHCEIVYFGVTAKLIGSGAGRWLMNRALELAWSRPIARLWLHTCTHDHPGAVAFYLRSGYRAFLRQIEIQDDPRLDGTAPRDAARHVPVIE